VAFSTLWPVENAVQNLEISSHRPGRSTPHQVLVGLLTVVAESP